MYQYPFTAIVGQEKLKLALLLCAVNPGIGGVLIKGEKGTAKSTAARGLQAVMPVIQNLEKEIAVPFVDLPIGASEDRVLGSLDLEAIVSEKKRKLLPGLLAAAHQGILYIDEVNLLADHLVDVLLDVAASGVNTIEREGLSFSHPARFVMIGTMNPEEGNLRPQFLDRFGLMVEVGGHFDVNARTEVVRRRMEFENDPELFLAKWAGMQKDLTKRIAQASALLPTVEMPEGLLSLISQLCIESNVASLRADIVMFKTAVTLAALDWRNLVNAQDIRQAAELVLAHRKSRKTKPQNGGNTADQEIQNPGKQSFGTSEQSLLTKTENPESVQTDEVQGGDQNECGEGSCLPDAQEQIFAPGQAQQAPVLQSVAAVKTGEWVEGRRSKATNIPKGFQVRVEKSVSPKSIAGNETVIHAIQRDPEHISIQKDDFHQKVKEGKTGHLMLFVVDASGSMSAGKRMEAVKGTVLGLLKDAYQKRDRVAVIAFRGIEANILLEPTSDIDVAEQAMETLPTGGRTPLAHALQLALEVLEMNKSKIRPVLILLSDGKANVPLPGGGDALQQSLSIAGTIRDLGIESLVLDTEQGYLKFGRAKDLAAALNAECLRLEELSTERITSAVSSKMMAI